MWLQMMVSNYEHKLCKLKPPLCRTAVRCSGGMWL